jgi:hypothetical protein
MIICKETNHLTIILEYIGVNIVTIRNKYVVADNKKDSKLRINVTYRCLLATTVAVEKQ